MSAPSAAKTLTDPLPGVDDYVQQLANIRAALAAVRAELDEGYHRLADLASLAGQHETEDRH